MRASTIGGGIGKMEGDKLFSVNLHLEAFPFRSKYDNFEILVGEGWKPVCSMFTPDHKPHTCGIILLRDMACSEELQIEKGLVLHLKCLIMLM